MAVRDHSWESVICGHHVYKAIQTPEIGEILECQQEKGNPEHLYTISITSSIIKDDTIVWHVPRVVWYFLEHDGVVTCQVTDRRKHGKGLEVPCKYKINSKWL